EDTTQTTLDACTRINGYLISILIIECKKYEPGYSHVAQLITTSGGKIASDNPLYQDVVEFVNSHHTTVEAFSNFVMKAASCGVRSGSLMQKLNGFKKLSANQQNEMLKQFVVSVNSIVATLNEISPDNGVFKDIQNEIQK